MSRSHTRRAVLSTAQRAGIERELRSSRLDEILGLLVRGQGDAEPPVADGLDLASSIGDLRTTLEAEADPLVALELLRAECRSLARQAARAGIDSGEIDPLVDRIDELVTVADRVPLNTLLEATDTVYSDAAAFEAHVVDTINHVQTLRLAGVAATYVLGRMGFDLTEEVLLGDEIRIRGSCKAGRRVQVSIDGRPPFIEVLTGDQTAVVRVFRHEDDRLRHRAVDLAVEIHSMIEREMREAGLGVGQVETGRRRRSAVRHG